MTELRLENRIRVVTAASLFDGHDVTINIVRRILQAAGKSSLCDELVQRFLCDFGGKRVALINTDFYIERGLIRLWVVLLKF